MEILNADVNIVTQDAYQNMMALVNSVDAADKSLEVLQNIVSGSERKLKELASALTDAEEHFSKTGSEADKLKMEQLRSAFDDTKVKIHSAGQALIDVQLEMHGVGEESKKTAAIISGANQTIVDTSKRAAQESAASTVEGMERQQRAIKETEEKVRLLNTAWLAASDTFKATGSMEAAANMERYAEQLAATENELGNLRRSQQATVETLSKSTKPAEQEAANLARAENQVATAAQRASRLTIEGSQAATIALREQSGAADVLGRSVSGVGDAINTMFAAFAGFQFVKQILDAIDERFEKIIEARRALGEAEFKAVSGSQGVAQALGLGQGKAGEDAAAALVAKFRERTGGLDEKGAADILARAQVSGFDVKGGQGAGFDIASTVGLFAKRLNIDPEAAGKLFNILNAAGAKTTEDTDRTLAQLEQAFRNIAMANPTQGVSAAIRGTVDRLEQGVSLPQAIGGVAAAAAANPDVRRAASDAERLSRVAIGGADKQTLELARAAQAQGLLSPQAVQRAGAIVAEDPTLKEHTEQINRANESISRMRESIQSKQGEIVKSQREANDAYTKFTDEQEKFETQQAEEQKKLTDPRYRRQREQIANRMTEQANAFSRRATDYNESVTDRQTRENQIRQQIVEENKRINDAQRKIAEDTGKDVQTRQDKALIEAYQQLPLGEKERVVWEATRGMSPQDAEQFIRRIGGTGAIQPLVKQLTGAGRAAFERAAGAAGGASAEDFRRSQQEFQTGRIAGRGQTAAAAERAAAESAAPGAEFANDIETLAKQDIQNLQAQGYGDTGFFRGIFNDVTNPFVSAETERRRALGTAGKEGTLLARRMLLVLRDRFDKFTQSMTPAQYARYRPQLDSMWTKLTGAMAETDKEGIRRSSGEILESAQRITAEIGAGLSQIQQDILNQGERNVPSFDPTNLQLPSQRNDTRVPAGTFAAPSEGPRSAAGAPPSDVQVAGGGSGLPAPSGPLAAAGGLSTTYNISVGTVVSSGGDLIDLPGRIGAADLNLG